MRHQKFMIGKDSFSNQYLTFLVPFTKKKKKKKKKKIVFVSTTLLKVINFQ